MSGGWRSRAARGGLALAAAMFYCLAGPGTSRAQVAPPQSPNPYSQQLLSLPPQEQAAQLAEHLGLWCIGTKPFFMGTTKTGHAKGYAYWSLTCAGAGSYLIQVAPNGKGTVADCRVLKESGKGRECYKTF